MEGTYHLIDTQQDILSHPERKNTIHILTLDPILSTDVYERIHHVPRMKHYQLIRPQKTEMQEKIPEIDGMAQQTVSSRLLIIDVRKATLPGLQRAYNKVVGYNRRDLNRFCYIILIGDGPWDLFHAGKTLDVFVPHLATHRTDFHPAVFFYDPLLHYERDEIERAGIGDKFALPDKIPRRLVPYFKNDQDIRVDRVRRYFRAIGKTDEVRNRRLRRLKNLYRKRIAEQFPHHKDRLETWLSKKGIRLASERLHLYPLFFEEWVYELMQKAIQS